MVTTGTFSGLFLQVVTDYKVRIAHTEFSLTVAIWWNAMEDMILYISSDPKNIQT